MTNYAKETSEFHPPHLMASLLRVLGRNGFAILSGALCFVWAFIGWLAVIPNQDILADGIQAQSLLRDPRVVLAFPGQKHAGPLEYPFTVLAEAIAPGNYFVSAGIRPVLAFLTGFLVARLFLRLFPCAPKWAFLIAIAVGPTIIHGLLGPEGNPVGVWWLQPNWDMAWLLVTAGALTLSRSKGVTQLSALSGGLLIGLGFYAHPAIILLIAPLLALVVIRRVPRIRQLSFAALGIVIGTVPAIISYFVNANINKWDPSHGAFIAVDYYKTIGGTALGLTGVSDYMGTLLPYSLGLAPSTHFLSGSWQSMLMWVFVAVVVSVSVFSVVQAIRTRCELSEAGAIAVAWLVAMATMGAFITFVDPVWIYSSGLAILFWLSLGALPSLFSKPAVGVGVTLFWLVLAALSTVTHNAKYLLTLPHEIQNKIDVMNTNLNLANALQAQGADVVFGSYYDAINVGYAANWKLRTITNHYNRFPLSKEELNGKRLTVAVNSKPTDDWGKEALESMKNSCNEKGTYNISSGLNYAKFSCSPKALRF